jgi:hypothetical protein
MRWLPLALLFLCIGCSNERITKDREARLKPVIEYVTAFVKEKGRLPSSEEFRAAADKMESIPLVLYDRSFPYAASKGARTETDFMIGIWRADWFHYYKSWDHQFLNGSDEKF